MEEIIRTEHLTQRYGSRTVVDDVSITVRKGEIYGFLGLNGAGKTTTIRCLLGMIKPTSGEVRLFGKRLAEGGEALWKRVGYLVETPAAYPGFTVRENLKLFARLRGIREQGAVEAVMEKLQMIIAGERTKAGTSQSDAASSGHPDFGRTHQRARSGRDR